MISILHKHDGEDKGHVATVATAAAAVLNKFKLCLTWFGKLHKEQNVLESAAVAKRRFYFSKSVVFWKELNDK